MKQITNNPPPNKPETDELTVYDKRTLIELILCLSYFLEEETPGSWQMLSVAGIVPNMSEAAVDQKFHQIFNRQ